MKYMNHLRKLALLSSLALSFSVAVHADGTLPLPLSMKDEAVALSMTVSYVGSSPRTTALDLNGSPIQACDLTDELYTAKGSVSLGTDDYRILGVCRPKGDPKSRKRKIITTDDNSTRITTLDGIADSLESFSTFSGTLNHKLLLTPTATNGQESDTSPELAPLQFKLRR